MNTVNMRWLSLAGLILIFSLSFTACQKELNFDVVSGESVGTLKSDSLFDCLPSTVTGTYQVDSTLGSGNYIDVQVDVNVAGLYTITSDTVNGYSFSGTGTFEHWWMSIARRACLDLLRKRYGNRIDLVDPHDLAAICGSEFAEPEWKTCQVGLLLDKLSEKCRLLLRLYFFDEMIYREIGETLEKSENAVRMSVKRCLEEARTLFSNHDDSYA